MRITPRRVHQQMAAVLAHSLCKGLGALLVQDVLEAFLAGLLVVLGGHDDLNRLRVRADCAHNGAAVHNLVAEVVEQLLHRERSREVERGREVERSRERERVSE